jgi:hypothetical protein
MNKAELLLLRQHWENFHESMDAHKHPPPALGAMIVEQVRDALSWALMNEDSRLTDTEKIEVAMLSLCDLMMRFSIYLRKIDFNETTELTPCNCFTLSDEDIAKLLKEHYE